MSNPFIDNIQIDEYETVLNYEQMFDLYDDMWDSMTESDIQDWGFVQYENF
jgi:hypothetical protein